mgnify:FL=1
MDFINLNAGLVLQSTDATKVLGPLFKFWNPYTPYAGNSYGDIGIYAGVSYKIPDREELPFNSEDDWINYTNEPSFPHYYHLQ